MRRVRRPALVAALLTLAWIVGALGATGGWPRFVFALVLFTVGGAWLARTTR